ncbi:dihydrolipoamide acetyltransferase family protein [Crenobacter luteus]|uniref:Dihydrolipoamide acetyltransferase component of pyruvate dehydrogenase complex n=1 Tax=Crenobacter luteus TaxID=1452487 RepID=A0A163BBT4_9NEIS|nr:dihydrolipoamide acetyltransferase family protein [Crenobacter luteus]KZE25940.1 branched-chain alpha-keto acid dehydrogenase subunit E2 [Crenobacter luteus]
MKTFTLPDLGEGLAEAEIVAWQVGEGDKVVLDQPLLSVETAKAIVDVPAPFAGKVVKLYARVGDIVPLGGALVDIDDGAPDDTGTVVGDSHVAATPTKDKPSANVAPAGKPAPVAVRAAPAVRALASRLGVELATLAGSGPDGAITSADVEAAARHGAPAAPEAQALRGPRRAMAQNMAISHAEVVPVLLVDDADIHAWPKGEDATWRLMRAMVAACRAVPALNAWFDGKALARRVFEHVDIGIALDTEEALFVPVIRHAEKLDRARCRAELNALKDRVRARSLAPAQLKGHTITLSNFGMFAGRYASPVVMPPTVAIVGAGRARLEPVAVGDAIGLHRRLPISITFDHRACTGAEAARFLAALLADLELAE